MSTTAENNLFSFDLSLLPDSSNNVTLESRIEKQRKSIFILKKKIVSTDAAVKNVLNTNSLLEESKKKFSAATEENKQICIDYNNALEKIRKLEKDEEISHRHLKELQEKLETSENQRKAIQSHANQLQQLVLDCETQLESLRIENQLAKVNTKEQTKNTQSKKIDYDTLINDLCFLRDVILGKKNLQSQHKVILKKYAKFKSNTDDSASECSVGDIEDVFNDTTTSFLPPDLLPKTGTQQVHQSLAAIELEKNIHNDDLSIKTIYADHDSDSNNEVVSEDTGRGSSLACSDIEKCYNSPDYFITNSPLSNAIMNKKNYTDISTSPITIQIERSDACTSPVLFSNKINGYHVEEIRKETRDIGITVNFNDLIAYRNVATNTIKINLQERASSPLRVIEVNRAIRPMEKNYLERVASPVQKNVQEKTTSPIKHLQQEKTATSTKFEEICPKTQTRVNETETVEINNSEVVGDNQDSDYEVENILKSVRLDYKLITPIPKSPAKVQKNEEHSRMTMCHNLEYLRVDNNALRDHVNANFVYDGKETTKSNDEHVIINIHDKVFPEENCKTVESPLKNSTTKLNIVGSIKPPNLKVSSEIVKVLNENQMHSNKPDDLIINQDSTVKIPIQVIDKIKTKKLTRLEKIRMKLLPRCKIPRDLTPPNRKISRLNPPLFQKGIQEQSATPDKNNKRAYENAVKIFAELKANEKNKPISSAPWEAAVNNKNVTKEIQIFIPKCDGLIAQNKNLISTLVPENKLPLVKSNVKSTTVVDNDSNVQNNTTKTYVNNTSTDIEKSPSQAVLRRSKRLSTSASTDFDILNKTIIEKEEGSTIKEVKCHERLKRVASDKIQGEPKKLLRTSDSSHTSDKLNTEESVNDTISKPIEYRRRSARLSTQSDSQNNNDLTSLNTISKPIEYRRKSARLSIQNESQNNNDLTSLNTVSKSIEYRRRSARLSAQNESQNNSDLTSLNTISKSIEYRRRSARLSTQNESQNNNDLTSLNTISKSIEYRRRSARLSTQNESQNNNDLTSLNTTDIVSYEDFDIFNEPTPKDNECQKSSEKVFDPKDSILCRMLEKYAKNHVKYNPKALKGKPLKSVCKKLKDGIARLISEPANNLKETMNRFVKDMSNCEMKYFLAALMQYLNDPARKDEMYKKVSILNSPPMTKSERVLLYILKQLQFAWPFTDFVEVVLSQIQFVLFQLNNTPEFGTVESMSHFYAVLCRYFGKITRLRSFIIDAMYCIQFKSVAVIKQCVEVWMHILPLAHMGIAKSPIVACLVYLLHFFKCEDKFNRVQEIRYLLGRKYFFQVSEWTESSILEMLQNAITDLSDIPIERKMLRLCLIIMAKRKGPQWCQKHIVNKMLLPLIEKDDVPEKIKEFCISMLGPLLKPYPTNMKANSEIVFDKLLKMLDHNVPPSKKEAIFATLLCLARHNQARVNEALLAWSPSRVSAGFEKLMANYVREKTAAQWKYQLAEIGNK